MGHRNNNSEFETSVLSCLTSIKENVNQHSIMLAELVRSARKSNEQSIVPPEDLPAFPIGSLPDLLTFDSKLLAGMPLTLYMVSRLAAVGGSNVEFHTRRIMKYVLTNEVAVNFNWKGRDKLSFEKTNIMAVIYDAAKLNYPLNERDDFKVANAVKDWLKFAKLRSTASKKKVTQ